jgi:glycerol-3-phosphate acyltransferase PlsY
MAAVLHPLGSIALGAAWLVVAKATRTASVASIAIAAGLPVVAALDGAAAYEIVGMSAVSALVIARHRENITRLRAGTERSLRAGS